MGRGCPINISAKQKINTSSSTEAELVGLNDALSLILCVRNFLEAQGYQISDNIVYQDNMSTIKLAKNGRKSSGKKARHIEIRYFFIMDHVKQGKINVQYCPTENIVADFFTKTLQGAIFRKLRAMLMNLLSDTAGQECVGAGNAEDARRASVFANAETPRPRSMTYAEAVRGGKNLASSNARDANNNLRPQKAHFFGEQTS
ncbi:hypothetical protein ACA910_000390 [Epithemia clementina (nom. ined.)]